MEGKMLLTVLLVLAADLAPDSWTASAVPINITEEPVIFSSGDVVPEVVSSGDTGSSVTPDLREGASATEPLHSGGCLDNAGVLHVTGSSWNVGCNQTCDCVSTPEGPIQHCSPPRCAIPMLSPGCQLVPNPRRNDTAGENCCDVVECKPTYCVDSKGGKHEVYTSWFDGELDCFCQYNFQKDTTEPSCILIQPEMPPSPPPVISELQLHENFEHEILVNETNETFNVCEDNQQHTYTVGEKWRVGCEKECTCVQTGEIASIECTPIPCPVPLMLPGCTIIPNPERDTVNSLNCCDKVVCPHHLCLGQNQLLYELNSVWYENGQTCTCILNYNINQALKKCGTAEEIQNSNQL